MLTNTVVVVGLLSTDLGRYEDILHSSSSADGKTATDAVHQPLLSDRQSHHQQQQHHRHRVMENLLRDTFAGACVSLIGVPMSIGFAIASGLHPIHALAGSIIAPLVNCIFGASKYTVLGSTAALSPILLSLMLRFQPTADMEETLSAAERHEYYHDAYNMLCIAGLTAGIIMLVMALTGLGKYVESVPHSVIVGFTVGLGITIGLAQLADVVSLPADVRLPKPILSRTLAVAENWRLINVYSVIIALLTFILIKLLLSISPFIPSPLIALTFATWINNHSTTWLNVNQLTTIADRYGAIDGLGVEYFGICFHVLSSLSMPKLLDVAYAVVGIIVVCSVESLLCSRMADRLASNQGTQFNSDKELHAQGVLQIVSCMMNSFPSTGALARTATNVKLNACSPLSSIAQASSAALLLGFAGTQLGTIPLPAIAGVLLYISSNMISRRLCLWIYQLRIVVARIHCVSSRRQLVMRSTLNQLLTHTQHQSSQCKHIHCNIASSITP